MSSGKLFNPVCRYMATLAEEVSSSVRSRSLSKTTTDKQHASLSAYIIEWNNKKLLNMKKKSMILNSRCEEYYLHQSQVKTLFQATTKSGKKKHGLRHRKNVGMRVR